MDSPLRLGAKAELAKVYASAASGSGVRGGAMTEPASHPLACLCRLDEKFDRFHAEVGAWRTEVGELFDGVEGRLGRIEEELLDGLAPRGPADAQAVRAAWISRKFSYRFIQKHPR